MSGLAERVRRLKDRRFIKGNVVYWMSRDQRVDDNWSLLYAMETASAYDVQLCVAFCLPPEYLGSTIRQYHFMVEGLKGGAGKTGGPRHRVLSAGGLPRDRVPFLPEQGQRRSADNGLRPLGDQQALEEKGGGRDRFRHARGRRAQHRALLEGGQPEDMDL